MKRFILTACVVFTFSDTAGAVEIASNGFGGGAWIDPATWRGKKTPSAEDDVVIQKNDVVVFDQGDTNQPSCRKLQIDPRGGLTFKTGGGKLVLSVSDGIESFGAIRVDATRSAADDFAIRLAGDSPSKRLIKLGKGGALLLYGRRNLPDDRRNVALVAPRAQPQTDNLPGLVDADGAMIDWQHAEIREVKLAAKAIDNTGAKPNQRIKVAESRFTGLARISVLGCDTPEIVNNVFVDPPTKQLDEPAINVHSSPLAEVKGNSIRGGFLIGIALYFGGDGSAVIDNTIEKCAIGINGGNGVPNVMIKHATIRGCEFGVKLEGATGVIEDLTVEGATTAFALDNSRVQITGLHVKDLAKKGSAIAILTGTLALLDCEVAPADVKIAPQKPPVVKAPPDTVTCMQSIVVVAKGAPSGSLIDVRTAKPPAPIGAADSNVRNSPAAVANGLTPLPGSVTPLIVKTWSFDAMGKLVGPPEYSVRVLGAAPKEGAERPVLATRSFLPPPDAVRVLPNAHSPTLEVLVK